MVPYALAYCGIVTRKGIFNHYEGKHYVSLRSSPYTFIFVFFCIYQYLFSMQFHLPFFITLPIPLICRTLFALIFSVNFSICLVSRPGTWIYGSHRLGLVSISLTSVHRIRNAMGCVLGPYIHSDSVSEVSSRAATLVDGHPMWT